MPATAHASSASERCPLTPTAPMMSPAWSRTSPPARYRHQVSLRQRNECIDEVRVRLGPGGQRPASDAHVQCAVGLAPGDAFAQEAGAILANERDEVTGSVEHGNRHRREGLLLRVLQGVVDDGARLVKSDQLNPAFLVWSFGELDRLDAADRVGVEAQHESIGRFHVHRVPDPSGPHGRMRDVVGIQVHHPSVELGAGRPPRRSPACTRPWRRPPESSRGARRRTRARSPGHPHVASLAHRVVLIPRGVRRRSCCPSTSTARSSGCSSRGWCRG